MPKKRSECLVFGRTVRLLRIKRGYSQEAFADKANMDRSYMGGIERGEFSPTISTVYRIAKALRVAPAKLFSNKPSAH
jgi:transcriptional regulator with XRE-family HTH domain